MKNLNKKILIKKKWLLLILIIAAVLRLWKLGVNPPHLSQDEAALGYNAYSILKTARDEHGALLPLIFKSFGDYKPGFYIYLALPSIALFGLNEFAVRLPGALSGITAVYLLYLIVKQFFDGQNFNKQGLNVNSRTSIVKYIAAFLLAINPWHIHFSRGAWEAGLSLTITLAAVYTFLQTVNKKPKYLFFSSALFALTLWTYQGAKLASFLVVFSLFFSYRKKIKKIPSQTIIGSSLLGFLLVIPILFSLFQGRAGRLKVFSIFSRPRPAGYVENILKQNKETTSSLSYRLYHTQSLSFFRGILHRWFNHFSGRFLFFEGDWQNQRHGVPRAGVLLHADSLLFILGLLALARLKKEKAKLFIWLWLLLSPLPAALSRDSIHAVRSLNMVVPLVIVLALGSRWLMLRFKKSDRFWFAGGIIFLLIYLGNYIYYLDQYWLHAPWQNAEAWHYGYKQTAQKVFSKRNDYKKVIVQQSYAQPYIYFLFYNQYSPAKYQKVAGERLNTQKLLDVNLVEELENIIFRDVNLTSDSRLENSLLIYNPDQTPGEIAEGAKIVDEIKYPNGKVAFKTLETN